jgi:hypothetical protein
MGREDTRSSAMAPIRWLAAVVVFLGWQTSVAYATESVWQALRVPGAVVVLRHSYAPGAFDPPDAKLDDCSTQRNLAAGGVARAEEQHVVRTRGYPAWTRSFYRSRKRPLHDDVSSGSDGLSALTHAGRLTRARPGRGASRR